MAVTNSKGYEAPHHSESLKYTFTHTLESCEKLTPQGFARKRAHPLMTYSTSFGLTSSVF